jgi:thiol:disulfide interchange protein DsbC
MKILSFMILLMTALFLNTNAYGFGGCEENCTKCHSLKKEEVQEILTNINAPDIKILDIKMSPVGGLWEITIYDNGAKRTMYLSFSKQYIVGGPLDKVKALSDKTQGSAANKNEAPKKYLDISKIPLANALLMGSKDAKYKVIVFTDPDCPFCGRLHSELKKVLSERKDISFHIMLMPLKMHPDAYWKSQSILCNKSLKLLEDNFEHKQIPKPECDTKIPDENKKFAAELDITGTPTLIMPDGLVIVGAMDAKAIIELALNPQKRK